MSNGTEGREVRCVQSMGTREPYYSMALNQSQIYTKLMCILSQAQYYRDPANLETYLSANKFLPYINNEIQESRNGTFKRNLATLNNLVLVMFTEDNTVIPKETAWFGAEVVNEEGKHTSQISQTSFSIPKQLLEWEMVPMRLQPIYLENWIGLRDLDDRNAITFEECKGEHMHLGECWKPLVKRFTGGFY